MPLTPDAPFPKAAGNPIRSKDWNELVKEAQRLDDDKLNRAGGTAAGPLTIQPAPGPKAPALRVNADALITGTLGLGVENTDRPLDVAGRIRLRQRPDATGDTDGAGMWLYQNTPKNDRAFVGLVDDNRVGFWGRDSGWSLQMSTATGNLGVRGAPSASHALQVHGDAIVRNVALGEMGHGSDWGGMSHADRRAPDTYALIQHANGQETIMNAAPKGILRFRIGNDHNAQVTIDGAGRIGTQGRSPTPLKRGWGGGIRTFDLEADGTVWSQGAVQTGPRDLAENWASPDHLEPGDVVCLDLEDDTVRQSDSEADPLVAGVVSTEPGMLLGCLHEDDDAVFPIALAGRVPCKVSAENGPIRKGDLLTTSSTPGHAMRALTRQAAIPGTLIGKALDALEHGTGFIDVWVTLT